MTKASSVMRHLSAVEPVGASYLWGRFHHDFFTTQGLRLEARVLLTASLRRSSTKTRFLILARARSGSTLLCQLLNAVPEIRCQKEMLHFKVAAPKTYLRNLARKSGAPVYGCKLLSYQIAEVQRFRDPERFFADLHEEGCKFIHLVRDTLSQCVSLSVAQRTGTYFHDHKSDGGNQTRRPLRLDPVTFVKQVKWNAALLRLESELLRPYPHERVIYHRDLEDAVRHQATVDRLCEVLGARPHKVEAKLKRVLGSCFEDVVENHEEIRRVLHEAGLDAELGEAADLSGGCQRA